MALIKAITNKFTVNILVLFSLIFYSLTQITES